MGLAARQRVLQCFSLQVMVDTYRGLYQRMLARPPARRRLQQEH